MNDESESKNTINTRVYVVRQFAYVHGRDEMFIAITISEITQRWKQEDEKPHKSYSTLQCFNPMQRIYPCSLDLVSWLNEPRTHSTLIHVTAAFNTGNDPPQYQAVASFWHEHAWDEDMLHSLPFMFSVPPDVIDQIRATPIELGAKDVRRWSLTSHGEFSVTSAWESIRTRLPKRDIFGLIWNQGLTPTMSVFIWRLLFGRLPVDEKLQRRGIELASRCQCCRSPSVESLSHVFFFLSQSAVSAWEYFDAWFPSSHTPIHTSTDIELRLGHWLRSSFQRAPAMHISFLVLCLIAWFLWTERNGYKHGGRPFRHSHVIWQVTHHLHVLVLAGRITQTHWRGCSPSVDFMSYSPRQRVLRSLMVLWHPPDAPWEKLNSDGAFSTSTLEAGEGGLVRGSDGGLLRAFCSPVAASSTFEAELLTLIRGLEMAMELSTHIWTELDSAALVSLLLSGHLGSVDLRHHMALFRSMTSQRQVRFSHIYREGNRATDFLAGRGSRPLPLHTLIQSLRLGT
ncbi:uncharacterized protein LOC121808982 [Salvia splendens]|uniref:uncharacterized protein LOC121808982 n=1 Tax=Salvia splendens TaxID=180675 RepID=UPI001C26EB22|nr:uncharacterized protein LOC121808982 [Salvia splendens]